MRSQRTPAGVSFGVRVDVAIIAVLALAGGGIALEMCLWAPRMGARDLFIGFAVLLIVGLQVRQRVHIIRSCEEIEAIRG